MGYKTYHEMLDEEQAEAEAMHTLEDVKASVYKQYTACELVFDRENHVYRVETNGEPPFKTLGIGVTATAAWEDSRRNIERAPVPELPNRGSSTWSLKSDEVFWRDTQTTKPVSTVTPAQSGRTDNDFRNEGTPDLSKREL